MVATSLSSCCIVKRHIAALAPSRCLYQPMLMQLQHTSGAGDLTEAADTADDIAPIGHSAWGCRPWGQSMWGSADAKRMVATSALSPRLSKLPWSVLQCLPCQSCHASSLPILVLVCRQQTIATPSPLSAITHKFLTSDQLVLESFMTTCCAYSLSVMQLHSAIHALCMT